MAETETNVSTVDTQSTQQQSNEPAKAQENNTPTVEYVESELTKRNINPLRWAIVHVSDRMYTVSVANLKE